MKRSTHSPLRVYALGLLLITILLGLDILSVQGIFAYIYQISGVAQPSFHALSEGIGIALIGIVLIYISIYRISESFILVSKYATALAIPLFIAGIIALGVQLSLGTLASISLLLVGLSSFLSVYQQEHSPHIHLRIGLLLWSLCYISSIYLLLLPLWLYSSYVQKSNSLRNVLAMLTGLAAPSSIALAYGLYKYAPQGIIPACEHYLQPLRSPELIGLSTPSEWTIALVVFLGLATLLSYKSGRQTESVRQRAQGSMLVAWSFWGIVMLLLYPQREQFILVLIGISILGARGLNLLPSKGLRIALSIIALLVGVTSLMV